MWFSIRNKTRVHYTESTEIKTIWCDQAKWVGTRYYWFLDRAHNSIQFPLNFIVFSITKMAASLEPYAQFWCFYFFESTHFAWSVTSVACSKSTTWIDAVSGVSWCLRRTIFVGISKNFSSSNSRILPKAQSQMR